MEENKVPSWICALQIVGIALIIASILVLNYSVRGIQTDIDEKKQELSDIWDTLKLADQYNERVAMAQNVKIILENFPETEKRNESLNEYTIAIDKSLCFTARALIFRLGNDTTYTRSEFEKLNEQDKYNKTRELVVVLQKDYVNISKEISVDEDDRNQLIFISSLLQVFGLAFIESKRICECFKKFR